MLRIGCIAASALFFCSHAFAADDMMTIDFVGDWCSPSKDKGTSTYALPSWTEDGKCTDILSIDK